MLTTPKIKKMTSQLIQTPNRDQDFGYGFGNIEMIMTPKIKKDLTSLFMDEDSGLGMDDDQEQTTPAAADRLHVSPLKFPGGQPTSDEDFAEMVSDRRENVRCSKRSLFCGKRKLTEVDVGTPVAKKHRKDRLRQTFSFDKIHQLKESDESVCDDIREAANRLAEDDDLVGDGANTFCLPTISGKHQDLKSITPQTVADVMNGKYDDVIGSCRVIDCRYPYEYNGGHIRGAENLYTEESILELLCIRHHEPTNQNGKRDILVFHCEFSSERGPKMSRFLRAQDRSMNAHRYPALTYPEVYLLHGGYKAFFETDDNKTLCHPMRYTPMMHKEHTKDLRHFRARSKSWTAGEKRKNAMRLRF